MKFPLLVIAVFLCICAVVFFGERISGGNATDQRVLGAVRTNGFIVDYVGEPVSRAELADSPSRVYLSSDGTRTGYNWFHIEGARARGEFKIEWVLPPRQEARLVRIFVRDSSGRDKLLWELQARGPTDR